MDNELTDIGMSEEEFERQFREATIRGEQEFRDSTKAVAARFDKRSKRIVIDLENGVSLIIPTDLIQGLQTDDLKALADFQLVLGGSQIHWNELDAQFYIDGLLKGVFGTPKWMSSLREHLSRIGRKGGSARTVAKRTASAENGKRGGRPKTKQTA